jgi:hypothetical protein
MEPPNRLPEITYLDKYLDAFPESGHIGQGRHVQETHYPSAASRKGRIFLRDGTSETFRLGTHCSGTHRHGIK